MRTYFLPDRAVTSSGSSPILSRRNMKDINRTGWGGIRKNPPPRPVVVGPVGRRPGPGFVWTGGYYRWGGTRGYVWVPADVCARRAPVQYGSRPGGAEVEADIHS